MQRREFAYSPTAILAGSGRATAEHEISVSESRSLILSAGTLWLAGSGRCDHEGERT